MSAPKKKAAKTKASTQRVTTDASKKTGEKKLLQSLHQKMKKAKDKKSAAEKDEKKAAKQLLDAEKKLERANANKSKAEANVKKRTAASHAATKSFEVAKAEYHALKDTPIAVTPAEPKKAISSRKTSS